MTFYFDIGCNLSGVSKVAIRSGTYIDAIQLFYCDGQSSEWCGGLGGSYSEFNVFPNDAIVAINIWTGYVVDSLQFITKNGILSPRYGNGGGGGMETIDAGRNKELIGFSGEIDTVSTTSNTLLTLLKKIDFKFAERVCTILILTVISNEYFSFYLFNVMLSANYSVTKYYEQIRRETD